MLRNFPSVIVRLHCLVDGADSDWSWACNRQRSVCATQRRRLCSGSGEVQVKPLLPLAAMQRAAAKPLAPPARDTQPLCSQWAWQMQKRKQG